MLPEGIHSQIFALARTAYRILASAHAPKPLRKQLLRFIRELRKELPKEALREIEAAEAEATIKAADYLRRPGPDR